VKGAGSLRVKVQPGNCSLHPVHSDLDTVGDKKPKKESEKATLSRVKKEMALPRITKSAREVARDKWAKMSF
jgi:hypothetical protein